MSIRSPQYVSRLEHVLSIGMQRTRIPQIDPNNPLFDQLTPELISEFLHKFLREGDRINTASKEFLLFCRRLKKDSMCKQADWRAAIKILGVTDAIAEEHFPNLTYESIFEAICRELNTPKIHGEPEIDPSPPQPYGQPPMLRRQNAIIGRLEDRFDEEWRRTYLDAMNKSPNDEYSKKARRLIRRTFPVYDSHVETIQTILLAKGFTGRTKQDWLRLDKQLNAAIDSSTPDLDRIKTLIRQGADVDYAKDGWPLLFEAFERLNFDTIEVLLEFGAATYVRDHTSRSIYDHIFAKETDIYNVSEANQLRMIDLLLDASDETREGYDPNKNHCDIRCGLEEALRSSKTIESALKIINHNSFDVNAHFDYRPPIIYEAILWANVPAIRAILRKLNNDELLFLDEEYNQPLEAALSTNDLDVVNAFVEDGRVRKLVLFPDETLTEYVQSMDESDDEDYGPLIEYLSERNL
ncbi:MAG: hypothetical protein VXA08_02355 [Alphaproteobacteria bacterium]